VSGSFVKIYGSILRSSVWQQPLATKVVWITMLALADEQGVVESSIPGLAATAGVSVAECEAALTCFLAPDKYSGSKVDDGRRVRERRGGWLIINHNYYRELRSERQIREADRIAGKRAQARAVTTRNTLPTLQHVANVAGVAPNAEADTDLGSISSSSAADPDPHAPFDATEATPIRKASAEPDGSARTRAAVAEVFGCWQTVHGKQRSKLESKRTARIKARLAEGFTVEQLCNAIRGAKKDPFLMGKDPRAGRAYDGLETLLRDAAQVERLITLEEGEATGVRAEPPQRSQASLARGRSVAEAMRHFQ